MYFKSEIGALLYAVSAVSLECVSFWVFHTSHTCYVIDHKFIESLGLEKTS